MPLRIGIDIFLPDIGGIGVSIRSIILSGSSFIAENNAIGATIGDLSVINGVGTYTFTITADPDSAFQLNADGHHLEARFSYDYETKTSHDVTIHADNGAGSVLDRTFTIFVTNVLEVTLGALTLSAANFTEHSAAGTAIGNVLGTSAGSTLSLVDSAGGRVQLSGTALQVGPTDSSHSGTPTFNITLRETHPDGINSPNDTVLTITVDAVVGGYVPTYLYFGF